MPDAEKSVREDTAPAVRPKPERTSTEMRKTQDYGSVPDSASIPRIGAFYPGHGFSTPVPPEAVLCQPGMNPFVSYAPHAAHNALYGQSSLGPYGMLYPGPSYDVSIALAALAVGEARALLQSTQEFRTAQSMASMPSPSTGENVTTTSARERDTETSQSGTWKRRPPLTKSRSDVPTWRKDGKIPIARTSTVPRSVDSLAFLDKFKTTRGRGCTLKAPLPTTLIHVSKPKDLSQDIKGNVALVGLDQMGSRWLQSQLDDTRLSGAKVIVGEVLESTLLLSRDVFGNYIVQKTLEYVDQENKDAIGRAVKGRMRRLSFDVYGCRVAQRLIEHTSTTLAVELARELGDVVQNCVVDTNASHVIQKCIQFLPSDQIRCLFDPLVANIRSIAKNASGCRIVQRLIEYCSLKDIRGKALNEVIDALTDLATSEYGNYVVQHVAQHGGPQHRSKAMHRIGTNFRIFSHHRYASRVVERFLTVVNANEKRYIIESMFMIGDDGFIEESWVLDMMLDPFGNYIVQKILEVAEDDIRVLLANVIKANKRALLDNGYGKKVADSAVNMGLLSASELRSHGPATEKEEE